MTLVLLTALAPLIASLSGPLALEAGAVETAHRAEAMAADIQAPLANEIAADNIMIAEADNTEAPSPPLPDITQSEIVDEAPITLQGPELFRGLTGEERAEVLSGASNALQSIQTAKGRFLQISPNGDTFQGGFYLKRPGRMRFEYDAPTPILIVSDGATVAIEDAELETVDRAPLKATPLDLLLKKRVDLSSDADVVDVRAQADRRYVELEDPSGETQGKLILEFSAPAFNLVGWTAVDPGGGLTHIALFDVETGLSLSPALFVLEDPEDDTRRR